MSVDRGSWRYLHSRKFLGLWAKERAAEARERAGELVARIAFQHGEHRAVRRSGLRPEFLGGLVI